ncbi:8-amino-7-oxononanoate synthase [Thermosinus carboxydivorans Nor1]|uniref:8-amino-7-ketopelargonate synthase n=1 Tax=Thermosinus carboxydivorans Nor1 TaxID=401526 RepID=A1HTZ4_9FIRM|nr:8-amino-7-oxononanoate synthase [Thermosinus carboxydivorans]EAX46515.1 8-amino-7-oxononanoate synthase [Thermosinus carboxydivorans Nor1]
MQFVTEALAEIKRHGLYRQIPDYDPVDAVHVVEDGRRYLMLASNNYLGLTHDPAVREAAAAAALRYGAGSGGARLTTGSHPLFAELERELAAFKGTEAALVFNTGYMANVGIISALAGPGDVIFSDELNHASIIDGCRLARAKVVVYRHADAGHLAECLATTPCAGRRLIVTDGVFSMDGDIAPLDQIVPLAEQYDALVMVDDAHATGVIGPGGRGTTAYFGLKGRVHIEMGTLSKALAAEGGYVAGRRELIDYLVNKARSFIFSTALAPATVAAATAALRELAARPALVATLQANARYLRDRLNEAGFNVASSVTAIIPVIVGEADAAVAMARSLKEAGLIVSAIRPPTVPPGTCRLRLTVSAAHSREDLAAAAEHIIAAGRRLGIVKE